MVKEQNVKKNFLYQFLYQVLISLLPFVTSPYISRVLGASQIGIYSFAYSIVTFFILFANLGITNFGNRLVAQNRDNKEKLSKEVSSLFYFHLFLSFFILLLYILYLLFFVSSNRIIAVIQVIFLIANMIDISWLFFGVEDFKSTTIRNSVVKIINCALIFILVKKKNDLYIYTMIMSIGTLCSQLILWPFAFKYIRLVKTSFYDVFKHSKKMIKLFGASLATAIYSYMDKIMLGNMQKMSELGFYENGWKLIEFPVGFILALGTVMSPKMTNLIVKKEDKKVEEYIEKSILFSMFSSIAIAFGIASISNEFSVIFWGKDFLESGYVIKIMAICIILMAWNGVIRNQYLIPKELDKIYLKAVVMGSIINLIFNFIFIPFLGAKGASLGTVLSYLTIFVIQNNAVKNDIPIKKYYMKIVPYFIIGMIMFSIVTILNHIITYSILGLLIKISFGGIIYVILLILYAFIFNDIFIKENIINIYRKVKK